eukprot:5887123-Pyramimonas_sp.AAC.1
MAGPEVSPLEAVVTPMAPPVLVFPSHPAPFLACVLRAAVRGSVKGRVAALPHDVTCLTPRAGRGPRVRIARPATPSWRSGVCRGHAERRMSSCPISALFPEGVDP